MPLPRPCEICDKRFQPRTSSNRLCADCSNEKKRINGLKIIEAIKRKKLLKLKLGDTNGNIHC